MILLLGAKGYIGMAFVREMSQRGLEHVCLSRNATDYTDHVVFDHLLKTFKPELVINCAAFVCKPSVDGNEQHRTETLEANTWLPLMLARRCADQGVVLGQVSTGCLYNGDKEMVGWAEYDPPHLTFETGAGVYVGSKELAERVVRVFPKHYLWRIRLPFDHLDNERNYVSKLIRYPKVFSALNSISHRGDYVKACLDLWERRAPFGTYNVTNQGAVTAEWICKQINEVLGLGKDFRFWKTDEFMQQMAKTRKSNCVLSVRKLLDVGVKIRLVDDAVQDSLAKWLWE